MIRFRLQTLYHKRKVKVAAKSRSEHDKKYSLYLAKTATLCPNLSSHFTE
jgi:hypothetical protein